MVSRLLRRPRRPSPRHERPAGRARPLHRVRATVPRHRPGWTGRMNEPNPRFPPPAHRRLTNGRTAPVGGPWKTLLDKFTAVTFSNLPKHPSIGSSSYWNMLTNGQRDGLPAHARLRELVGAPAWQTTHIGGHRFAPNVLVLPQVRCTDESPRKTWKRSSARWKRATPGHQTALYL